MTQFGYKLMSEEHPPKALIGNACLAEDNGFDFVAISDHFHPWLDEQGHASFIWSVLGAIAVATERVGIMTAVTCPFLRYHPAIIAQAAATISIMADGRFTLGLGTGEALNERVVGLGWPHIDERQQMLRESLGIIRALWSGEKVSFRGEYLTVEAARLYDAPDPVPHVAVAAGGPQSAELAAESNAALVATEARPELTEAYGEAGGVGPRYAELGVCWAEDSALALHTIYDRFRWSGLGWNVLPELAQPAAFRDATAALKPEQFRDAMPNGPELQPYLDAIEKYRQAGFDRLILTQVGPDQAGFLQFWERELGPAVRRLE